jgi:hypothetical protein
VSAVVTFDSGLENVTLDYRGIEKLKAHMQANKKRLEKLGWDKAHPDGK